MKIAHVLRRLSFDDWGGTEQVVWNIAKAQKSAGHDMRIFATTALCGTEHETVDGIDISRYRPVYPWWPMAERLIAELDKKGGNPYVKGLGKALEGWHPDVIHCHAMARIAELCLRTAKRTGAKSVVSLHGGGANVPQEEANSLKAPTGGLFPWGKLVDYAMGWTRRVPEDFDGIVCVGEDEAEQYRTRHPHVLFLPNGVDTSLFVATQPHKRTDSRLLLCVARIDRQKNQMMLVEALAHVTGTKLRLVGPVTQRDYRDELLRRAEELGVSDRLEIVGALKPASSELAAEYANADVFVLPSRHEPFGIAVLEAWAAGLPVVASDVGGLGRLCAAHPDAALTFPCGVQMALEGELVKILSDGRLREKIANNGKTAAKSYDWRNLSSKLVGFYSQLW